MQRRGARLYGTALAFALITSATPPVAAQPTTDFILRSELDGEFTYESFDVRVNEFETTVDDTGRVTWDLPTGPIEVVIAAPDAPFEARSLVCRDWDLPREDELVVDAVPAADGSIAASIEPVGRDIECTVTFGRRDTGMLTLEIVERDRGLAGEVDYRLTAGLPFDGQLTESQTPVRTVVFGEPEILTDLEAGPYTISVEDTPSDWFVQGIGCRRNRDEGGRSASTDDSSLLFDLEPGFDTECRIWLEYVEPTGPATLGIDVDSFDLELEGDFAYRLEQGLGLASALTSPASPTPIEPGTWVAREGLLPGPYTLTLETLPAGLVADVRCFSSDGGSIAEELHDPAISGSGRTVRVELEGGQLTDCSFWLREAEAGDVDDIAGGPGGTAMADPDVDPEPSTSPDASPDPEPSTDPEPSAEPDEPGDDVLAPLPGVWRSVNARSAIVCDGVGVSLPRVVDKGPIQVRRGGTRIVVPTQVGRIVLDQVEGQPGRYKGSIREKSLGATLKYDVRVKNPKRMTGVLRSDFRQNGAQCTLVRDFDSRWVSK